MTIPQDPAELLIGQRAARCPFEPGPDLVSVRQGGELPTVTRNNPAIGVYDARAVTRYADVRATFGHEHIVANLEADPDAPRTLFNQPGFLLGYDGPEHARLRRMLTGAFTVRRLGSMRPWIERIVAERLDAMREAGPVVDLVQAYALPIPSMVICELLGVPYADRDDFQTRSALLLDGSRTAGEQAANYAQMYAYMAELVARLRAEPGDSLLGEVITSHGDEITDEELIGFGNLLLIAGHETTSHMIALGTLVLLENPGQLAVVRDEDAAGPAIEELLRYLSVVTYLDRRATADLEINDNKIAAEERLSLSLLAANHDPELVGANTGLDVRRKPVPHLAFGFGVHQCLGQQLARIELRAALPALLRRFPALRLAVPFDRLEFRTVSPIYAVASLPLTW